jgi:pimeloyl-ACP methyl ester carboxylesterase
MGAAAEPSPVRSRYVLVDGIRTHYLDAGDGPTVVLLHSAEFGGCAELSWEETLPAIADRYRVVAPDWLGFGKTDKIHDFKSVMGRMLSHMRRFLEIMCIDEAHFVGSSMAGSVLLNMAAQHDPGFPMRSLVAASGGGFVPNNEARQIVQGYDCTLESMRATIEMLFHSPSWPGDEAYVERRFQISLEPGAWECAAAARFRAPIRESSSPFGRPDETPYEQIGVRTLLIAGANDKLREPGYATEVAARIPDGRAEVLPDCGHLPNVEQAAEFNRLLGSFLDEVERTAGDSAAATATA